jgi:uncharacterized protein (TIGR03118 family)
MSKRIFRVTAALVAGAICGSLSAATTAFFQTNLTSDIPGMAANTDANLKNPWGMSFSATSPFWASDQGAGKSTLYNPAGVPQALVVTIPSGIPPGPTGTVFSNIAGNFLLPVGTGTVPAPATFLFDTLSGTIAGWNGAQGTTAATTFTAPAGTSFTGLAIANNGAGNFLYAADFANGAIDVFNSSFAPTTLAGNFTDTGGGIPAGYFPYNVQTLNGKLYVEYATKAAGRAAHTPNTGIVDVFDLNGNFLQRLVTNANLNSPWGITQAPATFPSFGGDILVGNFGDGTISAFDPTSGIFLGKLSNQLGNPIVDSGLWALNFRSAASGADPNTLFLNAGINNEADGLFAEIQVVPEPSTFLMLALAGIPLAWRKLRSQKS